MKSNSLKKLLIILTVFLFLASAMTVNARMKNYHGQDHGKKNDCSMQNLNKEDVKKVQNLRKAFAKNVSELKQDKYEKKMELRSILAKRVPDYKKAKKVQSSLTAIQGKLDQKRIDLLVNIKKINPKAKFKGMHAMMDSGCKMKGNKHKKGKKHHQTRHDKMKGEMGDCQ